MRILLLPQGASPTYVGASPREGGGLRLLRNSGGNKNHWASLRAATWIPAFAGKALEGRKYFHKYELLFKIYATTQHKIEPR